MIKRWFKYVQSAKGEDMLEIVSVVVTFAIFMLVITFKILQNLGYAKPTP